MAHTDAEERMASQQTQDELDAEYEARVIEWRIRLHQCLTEADQLVKDTQEAHRTLSSGAAWDAEYEGGGSFIDHVNEAGRLLVIARALIPTDANGNHRKDKDAPDVARALMRGSYLK